MQKGIVSDPNYEFGIAVVEVLIFVECGCTPKTCGQTKFSDPIELTYTQCQTDNFTFEELCQKASKELQNNLDELAANFCGESTCNGEPEGPECRVQKIDRSKICHRKVNVNGNVCCEAKLKVYGITCGCPPPPV